MFLSVTILALLSAEPCTLSGKIELTRAGKSVDPGGIVAVYVEKVRANAFRTVNKTHQIVQSDTQFRPKVLVLLKGDSVEFTNNDKWEHSVFAPSTANAFEFSASKRGLTGVKTFLFPGKVRIQCDIHKKMRADVLVASNPFFALADAGGAWKISGLPSGDYTLVAWEPNGKESRVSVTNCTGPTAVTLPVLEEAPPPKLNRKLGGDYGEYQNW